ncbi:MAG: TatD family hydrolase [Terrimicrobiaceae bacterium]
MFIDTHAHLDYPDFAGDIEDVIRRAREHDVERIITIGTGLESSRRAVALADQFEGVFAVVGVHPTCVEGAPENFAEELAGLLSHPKVVAIGETGLDYHRLPAEAAPDPISALGAASSEVMHADVVNGAYKAAQADAFRVQLDLAVEHGLNVVIHQRDAWSDTLEILKPYEGRIRGVFHCFGGTSGQALEVIRAGHLVSFTGIITFKNAAMVRETAAALPAGSYMVETDCPYLAPVPHRGGRCEPWHTALVAAAVATARGITTGQVALETSATAEGFFAFKK